jgi:DNA-binding NtrC family response regulator
MLAKPDGHPAVVLIADDEESICFSLASEVRRLGGVPLVAADGLAALELARACRGAVDLALLDVRMPRLDGLATLDALRSCLPALRCCLMTAWGADGLIGRWPDSVVVLSKPFDLDDVARVLTDLLDHARIENRPSGEPASSERLVAGATPAA